MKGRKVLRTQPADRICLFAGFAILALALVPMTHAQAAAEKQVSYHGVTFSYDTSLARSVTAETVPEQIAEPNGRAWWMSNPEHIKFTFNDWYASIAYREPTIYVFPIRSSYRYLNPGESRDLWLDTMDVTRSLVTQKRKLDPYRYADVGGPGGGSLEQIPFLPLQNSAVPFVGKQRFLDFQNGNGFRCFTTPAQDYAPVTRDNTLYTYQGISSDGKYYVSAAFPAFLASPPASFLGPGGYTDEAAYNRVTIKAIEESSSSQFQPNLDKLDALIQSLTTPTSTSIIPGMPATGGTYITLGPLALLAALLALATGWLARRVVQA